MNRRDLLKYLISTPLATVIDYEKLLWVPGEKKIFIPSPAQSLFFREDRIFLYGGGAGGGKSWLWDKTSYNLIRVS